MLLIVADQDLNDRAPWIVTAISNEVEHQLDDVAFAIEKVDLGELAGKSAVATMFTDTDDEHLRRAAAASARIVIVTASPERICERLGLREEIVSQTIRLGIFLTTSDKPEKIKEKELRTEYGADWVKVLWETETRTGYWTIGRRSGWLAEGASDSHRLDPEDSKARRETAAQAAASIFKELLNRTDVEEYQIRGVEAMYILLANGMVEEVESPFNNYDDLTDAVKFLASYGGDASQRFDRLSPQLDIQIAGHWRLHAEAYVTNPPHIVLRYNRGKIPLEDLLVGDWRMTAILREAIAGESQANLVVASTMGGGKTTLCQALLGEVHALDRIDTIEDTPELRLAAYGIHSNTYERLTRDANNEGIGEHSMEDHIRDAKRANTRKLVVGETRGPGTLAMLDAMTSGLDGCLVTIHSRPGAAVIEKLTAYAQMDGAEPAFARRQIANSVHLMAWLTRNDLNQRIVGDLSQLIGIDEGTSMVRVRVLWKWEKGSRWAKPVGDHPEGRMGELYLSAGVNIYPDNPEEERAWDRSMIGRKAVMLEGKPIPEGVKIIPGKTMIAPAATSQKATVGDAASDKGATESPQPTRRRLVSAKPAPTQGAAQPTQPAQKPAPKPGITQPAQPKQGPARRPATGQSAAQKPAPKPGITQPAQPKQRPARRPATRQSAAQKPAPKPGITQPAQPKQRPARRPATGQKPAPKPGITQPAQPKQGPARRPATGQSAAQKPAHPKQRPTPKQGAARPAPGRDDAGAPVQRIKPKAPKKTPDSRESIAS